MAPPLGELAAVRYETLPERVLKIDATPSPTKIKDFCHLSQRERQVGLCCNLSICHQTGRKSFCRGGVLPLPKADFRVEATTGGAVPLPYNPTYIIPNRGVVGAAPYKDQIIK